MLTAKAFGAKTVVMTDVVQAQLDFAKKSGADYIFNVKEMGISTPEAIAAHIQKTLSVQFDSCIECSGFEMSLQTAIHSCKPNGTVVMIGMADSHPRLPVSAICVRELKMKGIFRYRFTYPKAIELIATGKLKVDCMLPPEHGRFPLSKVHDAFAVGFPKPGTMLHHPKPIKVMIDCSPDEAGK